MIHVRFVQPLENILLLHLLKAKQWLNKQTVTLSDSENLGWGMVKV